MHLDTISDSHNGTALTLFRLFAFKPDDQPGIPFFSNPSAYSTSLANLSIRIMTSLSHFKTPPPLCTSACSTMARTPSARTFIYRDQETFLPLYSFAAVGSRASLTPAYAVRGEVSRDCQHLPRRRPIFSEHHAMFPDHLCML